METMTATILDGRALATTLAAELRTERDELVGALGFTPILACVVVGDHQASRAYISGIARASSRVGLDFQLVELPGHTTEAALRAELVSLNRQHEVCGIIVQLPLPPQIAPRVVAQTLAPEKDIDGVTPANAGRLALGLPALLPSTPAGGMELLRRNGIALAGCHAVVAGRSAIVGKPMALLLLQEHATVTICHSRTPDLAAFTREADLVAVGVGQANLITGAMIKPGAVVVDFGINVDEATGKLVGDVDFAAVAPLASAITPVPGGTGPVTNMMLARNTLLAARSLASDYARRTMPD